MYVANEAEIDSDFGSISVVDAATASVAASTAHVSDPESIAITADGHQAYVIGRKAFSVVDTQSNKVVAITEEASGSDIVISPDERRAYIYNNRSGGMKVIDLRTYSTALIGTPGFAEAIATAPDGSRVYAATHDENFLSAIDSVTNKTTAMVPLPGEPRGLAVSQDGRYAYVTYHNQKDPKRHGVAVIDTRKNAIVSTISTADAPTAIALSPDGRYAYVTIVNKVSNAITMIDTTTKATTATLPIRGFPRYVAISPDGRRAYVSSSERTEEEIPGHLQVINID